MKFSYFPKKSAAASFLETKQWIKAAYLRNTTDGRMSQFANKRMLFCPTLFAVFLILHHTYWAGRSFTPMICILNPQVSGSCLKFRNFEAESQLACIIHFWYIFFVYVVRDERALVSVHTCVIYVVESLVQHARIVFLVSYLYSTMNTKFHTRIQIILHSKRHVASKFRRLNCR